MFKQFEDFLFAGKKFSDLSCEYIPANLNTDFEISLALERDMESGTKNNYRPEANYFGDSWSVTLTLELHIIKSPTKYPDQESQFLSKKDLREITRWLTSPHYPQWIVFDLPSDADDDVVRYRGWFSNIEALPLDDKIYGLKLFFTCTTPFGYTTTITQKKQVITYGEQTVVNNSDESLTYCYPVITILPHDNGEIFLCNLSDCNLLDSGKFSDQASFSSLISVIEDYSAQKGYIVTYTGTGSKNIIPLCQNTAVQFYLRDVYNGTVKKCTAFYRMDTKEYRIVDGGFVYMKVYQNLDISMDCQFLTINDSIGRMVTYDKLGITDVDHVYWPRLLHGENHLLLYGNADFIVQHQESRKAGEY